MDISNWPSLQAGECIQLPLLGTIYQTYIPSLTSANLQQVHSQPFSPFVEKVASIETISTKLGLSSLTPSKIPLMGNNDEISRIKKRNSNQSANINSSSSSSNLASSSAIELTREDILDNYKQSKEMLLAKKMALAPNNSINKMDDNNENNDEDDDDDEMDDVDDDVNDDDSYSDIKLTETENTQIKSDIISSQSYQLTQQLIRAPIVLSSVHEIDIFRSLYTVLSYTHLLWELVLTAEPIVVMATSPCDCSHMVQSLIRYAPAINFIFSLHNRNLSAIFFSRF